jgi:hypothetical protein
MQKEILKSLFKVHKEKALFNRFIHAKSIEPLLENLPSMFNIERIGQSVNKENIFGVSVGHGDKKILMWSQMHGNESTTTKALFDVFNFLSDFNTFSDTILNNCSLMVIPMLNPDGAVAYTRFNANGVDLNRDSQNLSQPESMVLKECFNKFQPNFCFNLHGQRTIFSAGKTNLPATLSFLAPAQDATCSITSTRKKAMEIIAAMNTMLQKQIPNQVGVYDDAFNLNCVGDAFQSHNVPTILFEAGHFKNDYKREDTRAYVFQSLVTALHYIAVNTVNGANYKTYFDISKNEKLFFDIIIRNAIIINEGKEQRQDIGILYKEQLNGEEIEFIPIIEKIANLNKYYGHKEINANNNRVLAANLDELKVGYEIDCVLINNRELSLKLKK